VVKPWRTNEGYVSLQQRRRFVGVELKESYWRQAVRNLTGANAQHKLFADSAA